MTTMVWGWPVAWYLFLGGMGAGAMLAGLAAPLVGKQYAVVERAGAAVAGPAVAVGTGLLVFDLGIGRHEPWRIAYLYLNGSSPMTWGTWILTLFVPVALLYALSVTESLPSRWERVLTPLHRVVARARQVLRVTAGALAVSTAIYTGVLLSMPPTFPLLNNWLLPALFLASALSTGLSVAVLVAFVLEHRRGVQLGLHPWSRIHIGLLVGEIAVLLAWLGVSAGAPVGAESVQMLVTGALAPVFWLGVVAFGLVGPAIAFVAETAPGGHSCRLALTGEAGVLVGGLALRYLVLAAAVPILARPPL